MASVSSQGYFHTSPSPREDRVQRDDTDGLPPRECEAIGPLIRWDSHCSLVCDASHPWEADPIGFALLSNVAEIWDAPDKPSSSNGSPAVGYGERQEQKRRDRERGLRGVAALVGTRLGVGSFVSWTLLLARINLLPPPLAPPLARYPTAVPSSAIPPRRSRKGGFESPPVLAAARLLLPLQREARETAHADSANHPRRPLLSRTPLRPLPPSIDVAHPMQTINARATRKLIDNPRTTAVFRTTLTLFLPTVTFFNVDNVGHKSVFISLSCHRRLIYEARGIEFKARGKLWKLLRWRVHRRDNFL